VMLLLLTVVTRFSVGILRRMRVQAG
jgi:hypothetical protein